jgi:hypothetical protein
MCDALLLFVLHIRSQIMDWRPTLGDAGRKFMKQNKVLKWVRTSRDLYLVPFLVGLLIGVVAATIEPFADKFYQFIIISLIFFLWGIGGLIIYIRRELLQSGFRIKGRLAMVYGALIMLFCWSLSLYILYAGIRKIIMGIW